MSEDIQQVELCGFTNFQYKVDVNVILQIADFHLRNNNQLMVVTLMGTVYPNKIEVMSCFRLVASQQQQIENIQKVFPKQYVVGFGINKQLNDQKPQALQSFQQLHKQYYEIMQKQPTTIGQSPFFITVDIPSQNNYQFNIKGYVDQLEDASLEQNLIFYQPVQIQYEIFDQNKSQMLNFADQSKLDNQNFIQLNNFILLLEQLKNNISQIKEYVQQVQLNEEKGDSKIGLSLKKLIRDIPKFNQEQLNQQITSYLEDVSLIMYLKNLLNLQAVISDKINKIQ